MKLRLLQDDEIVITRAELGRAIHDSIAHTVGTSQDWIERMHCEGRAFSYYGEAKCMLRADAVLAALHEAPLPEGTFLGVYKTAFGGADHPDL